MKLPVQVIFEGILSQLRVALTINLIASTGLFLTFFLTSNQAPFTAGCILAMHASHRRLLGLRSFADGLLSALERIVVEPAERGDAIGSYCGFAIHDWVSPEPGGTRYAFVGKAHGAALEQDQIFVFPGLIYRREPAA